MAVSEGKPVDDDVAGDKGGNVMEARAFFRVRGSRRRAKLGASGER